MAVTGSTNDGTNLGGLGYTIFTGADNQAATTESNNVQTGEFDVIRSFIGPWSNRIRFIDEFLLIEQRSYPDRPAARITTWTIKGHGKVSHNTETNQEQFERALFTVNYSFAPLPPIVPREGTPEDFAKSIFIEESNDSSAEFFQTEGADWKIAIGETNANDKLGENFDKLHILIPTTNISIKITHLIKPFWLESDLCQGKINDNAFISPSGIVFEKETLRYEGRSGVTKLDLISGDGEEDFPFPIWELTHHFTHNPKGWNKKYHKGKFQKIIEINTSGTLYQLIDLYIIFFGVLGNTYDKAILTKINDQKNIITVAIEANPANVTSPTVINAANTMFNLVRDLDFRV